MGEIQMKSTWALSEEGAPGDFLISSPPAGFGFAARPRPKCRVASLTADREKAAACAAALALTRISSLLAATNR